MSLRWRVISVGLLLLVFGSRTGANFIPKEQRLESAILPDDLLRLGLDLQGGIHWVVGVDLDAAVEEVLRSGGDLPVGLSQRVGLGQEVGALAFVEGLLASDACGEEGTARGTEAALELEEQGAGLLREDLAAVGGEISQNLYALCGRTFL